GLTTVCCENIVLNLPIVVGVSETFSANGQVIFSNSIDLNGQTLRLVPYITRISGSIIGSGGFVLDPGGGLNLVGTSSFTGTFTVSPSASINVAGSISNSSLAVGTSGRLSGAGTIPATSLTDATLSVSDDAGAGCCADPQTTGILSTGNLSIQGGTVLIDIRSTTPGTGYDQIKTTGTVTLIDPTLQVVLPGLLPAPGQSFTIIDNDGSDSIVGTFNGLPEGATFTASGVPFRITYTGGTGNDVVLIALGGGPKSWTGAVSGLWSEGGNWNGGVAPINGDSVVFPSGPGNFGLMTNDLSGLSLQSVSFTGGPYNLSGNSVVISGGLTTVCCENIVLNLPI